MVWADDLAKKIIKERGKNLVVATGVTPSGPIHLGNLKEVMVGHLITQALIKQKAKLRFILLIDDFDPLRKLYPFLPQNFEKYIGMPLCKIPDPRDCHKSYSEHFLADFLSALEILNVKPEILYAQKLYEKGVFAPAVKKILENREKVAQIIQKVSGRKLENDWSPLMPLCAKCGKLTTAKVTGYELNKNKVLYQSESGFVGSADFSKAQGKLVYRLQWPSTWKIFGVSVEGFGKDHATKGGTFDTASSITKEIFKSKPPFGIPFEWVYVKGQGKMAGSTGVGFTPLQMLEILPPEIIIHFYSRSKPNKHYDFDISQDVPQLWSEHGGLSGIPFDHLAMIAQSAPDFEGQMESLERTGYKKKLKAQKTNVKKEIECVKNWLEKYASERYKFEVQEKLPNVKLSSQQKEFLSNILQAVAKEKLDGEKLHQKIHEIKNEMKISPRDAFSAIYLIFLGKESGPQAGWFLAGLDREFVIKRLKEVLQIDII